MTGQKKYYKVFGRLKFYLAWRDDKFYKVGFTIMPKMTLEQAVMRLEKKRLWRENNN